MEDLMVKVILGAIEELEQRLETFATNVAGEYDTVSQTLKAQAVYMYTPAPFLIDNLFEDIIEDHAPAPAGWHAQGEEI